MVALPADMYHKLQRLVAQVDYNNLFAIAVVDSTVRGLIYVNDIDTPRTCYIVHPYGMSLLCGDHTNAAFNNAFREHVANNSKSRTTVDWMQVYPAEWNTVLPELLRDQLASGVVELNTRVNFRFDVARYREQRARHHSVPAIQVQPVTPELFEKMNGSVVPKAFWDSAADFQRQATGFAVFVGDKLAATAFSSFRAPGKLELGIETIPEFRGQGVAEEACAALIDYCLQHNLEPIWACRKENTGSYKLALKLGFVVAREMPYYKLGV